MNCSIFLKSYDRDAPWLEYSLRSIRQFATGGFSEIVVAVPEGQSFNGLAARVVQIRETGNGYLFQQNVKLHADALTDADYILYMDSDTIFTKLVIPEMFFTDGKPNWMVTPYDDLLKGAKVQTGAIATGDVTEGVMTWKRCTEKFLGRTVDVETMRRHPQVVPRWLLASLRDFCQAAHGISLDRYVMQSGSFSEFNAMGAFAYYRHHDEFHWINTAETPADKWPELVVLQKFSHGGLTDEIRAEFETILSGRPPLPLSQSDSDEIATVLNCLAATAPQRPWLDRSESVAEIKRLASRLREFQVNPRKTYYTRQLLHEAGVIQLAYRYKKRKGWKKKKVKI